MRPSSFMNAVAENNTTGPVLLFDGECGLCNRVVRLLLRFDTRAQLRFAPLQGASAQAFLRAHGLQADDFETLVFVPHWRNEGPADSSPLPRTNSQPDEKEFLLRTDGVIAALRLCGGAGRLLGDALALFPRPLRDAGYRFVARVRYRIFGPWRACPLPRPEWAARFLT